jgi:hypothetical protein
LSKKFKKKINDNNLDQLIELKDIEEEFENELKKEITESELKEKLDENEINEIINKNKEKDNELKNEYKNINEDELKKNNEELENIYNFENTRLQYRKWLYFIILWIILLIYCKKISKKSNFKRRKRLYLI